MRITVWGINYAPEVTGIAPFNQSLCDYLAAQGHQVQMVTTFSYYPAWRKRPEDCGRLYRRDRIGDVTVHRCWHFVPRRVTPLKRILHEATFVAASVLRVLTLRRPEVLVVVSPPLLLGAAGGLVSLLRRTPMVFHVQDLQPDAALGLGMLKPGMLTRSLQFLERLAYRCAARVSGISHGMVVAFRRKGVPEGKCVYFPNSIDRRAQSEMPRAGGFRRRHGFSAENFLAVYSGNLGVKQGLHILLEAAKKVTDSRIRVVICGDGAERAALASAIYQMKLGNVLLLPLQDEVGYAELLVDADVCFITQQPGAGRAFFPSKLLPTLSHGKPVLTVADADSELARAVEEGSFGVNVAPGNAEALSGALETLAVSPELLAEMSWRGREYVARFDAAAVLPAFEDCLRSVAEEWRPQC